MTCSKREGGEKKKRSRAEVKYYLRHVQKNINLFKLEPVFCWMLQECIQNDFTV